MKNSVDMNDDQLRKYIRTEHIEKAPDGLSERIMLQIRFRQSTSVRRKNLWDRYSVPLITLSIIVGLIILQAVLLPVSDNYTSIPEINILSDYSTLFRESISHFFAGLNFPALLTYIAIGIFMLTILDYVLSSLFRKKREQEN